VKAEATQTPSFLSALAALATRVSADGVEIYSVTYQSQGFGSWELEAGRRRVRVQVSWQGKDRQLRVSIAQLESGSTERKWQLAEEHDFRNRRTDLGQLFGTVQAAITAHTGV
jgi:hypothetical protein